MGLHIGTGQQQAKTQTALPQGIPAFQAAVQLLQGLGVHAAAPVAHRKGHAAVLPSPKGYLHRAAALLGLDGVGQQVEQHTAHLVLVGHAVQGLRRKVFQQPDAVGFAIGPGLFQQCCRQFGEIQLLEAQFQLSVLQQSQVLQIAGHAQQAVQMQLHHGQIALLAGLRAAFQLLQGRQKHPKLPVDLPGNKPVGMAALTGAGLGIDGEQGDLDAVAVLPGLGGTAEGLLPDLAAELVFPARKGLGHQPGAQGVLQKIIQVPAVEVLPQHHFQHAAGKPHPAGRGAQKVGFGRQDMLPKRRQTLFRLFFHGAPPFPEPCRNLYLLV